MKFDFRLQTATLLDAPVAGPSTDDTLMSMTPDSPDSDIPTDSEDDDDQVIDDGGLTIAFQILILHIPAKRSERSEREAKM